MTTIDLHPDCASQPDRPLPFPAIAEALRARRETASARDLYDTAPALAKAEKPMPMTPAVPMPALKAPSRAPRFAAIAGGLMILGSIGGASILWSEEAPTLAPVAPVPAQVTAQPKEVIATTPKTPKRNPQAELQRALAQAGLTMDDLGRIDATKSSAEAYGAKPDDPEKADALAKSVAAVVLSRSDAKRKLYHLTKLMRTLDGSDVNPKEVGPLWRDLLEVKKDLEAKSADPTDLARRMTAIEGRARALLP